MPKRPEYLDLPFKEAIAYFKDKVPFPTQRGQKVPEGFHDHAFTVTGLTKGNLLEDIKWLLERAMQDGQGLDDFTRQFDRLVGRKGWQPGDRRIQTIFDTNVRRSYAAGRREQMLDPDIAERRPGWMWIHRTPDPEQGGTPRPHHKALNRKVFRNTEPFWNKAFPQCAWGCRCGVMSLSEKQMKRMGVTYETPPDPNTIAEPGFRSAPGMTPKESRQQVLEDGLKGLSPSIRERVEKDLRDKGVLENGDD